MLAVPVRLVRQVPAFWWIVATLLILGPFYLRYLVWVLRLGCVEFAP